MTPFRWPTAWSTVTWREKVLIWFFWPTTCGPVGGKIFTSHTHTHIYIYICNYVYINLQTFWKLQVACPASWSTTPMRNTTPSSSHLTMGWEKFVCRKWDGQKRRLYWTKALFGWTMECLELFAKHLFCDLPRTAINRYQLETLRQRWEYTFERFLLWHISVWRNFCMFLAHMLKVWGVLSSSTQPENQLPTWSWVRALPSPGWGKNCFWTKFLIHIHLIPVRSRVCKNFDFIIVRCNPGQIKARWTSNFPNHAATPMVSGRWWRPTEVWR